MELEEMIKKRDELTTLLRRFFKSLGFKFSNALTYTQYGGVSEERLRIYKDNVSFLIQIIPILHQESKIN